MACEQIDRLMQTIRVHTPGVTDDMIRLIVFNTADEFLRRTGAWRYETEIDLNTALTEYPIPVPNGATLVRVISVTHNNVPVQSATGPTEITWRGVGTIEPDFFHDDGDALFDSDANDLEGGNIFTWAIYRPEYITVTIPSGSSDLVQYPLKLWMMLSVASQGLIEEDLLAALPEWMLDMYFQDWLDGALSKLYGMPMKPWSNPQHAIYHGRRFRNSMGFRKQEANRGFIYNPPPPAWRFPRGW
jgi:hypothetical protein